MEAVRTGRKERALATSAKTGMILGWVTVGLSGVTVVLVGVGVLIYWLR